MARKTYRTMQGKEIDMDALLQRNELMPAVGNARVNARGDELGPGGKIIKKREEVIASYYEGNPNAYPDPQYPKEEVKVVAQKVVERKSSTPETTKKSANKIQGTEE